MPMRKSVAGVGDVEGALGYQRQAIALLRGTVEMAPLAHAIRHLADILVENGRAAEANASITEMLQIYASTTEAPPPRRRQRLS